MQNFGLSLNTNRAPVFWSAYMQQAEQRRNDKRSRSAERRQIALNKAYLAELESGAVEPESE